MRNGYSRDLDFTQKIKVLDMMQYDRLPILKYSGIRDLMIFLFFPSYYGPNSPASKKYKLSHVYMTSWAPYPYKLILQG